MNKEIFDIIEEKAIQRAILDTYEYLKGKKDEYDLICLLDKNNSNFNNEVFEKLHKKYEEYKDYMKEVFFDVGVDNENRIDIHKIGACLTAALIDVRVFKYSIKEELNQDIFLSNYMVAFLTGIHLIYLNMVDEFKELIKNNQYVTDEFDTNITYSPKKLLELLEEQHTIRFPKTNSGHDPYDLGRIKALALNDIAKNDFNLLTYADMLFWIEKYNKYYLINQIKKTN